MSRTSGRTGGKTSEDRDGAQDVFFHEQNAIELAEYLLPHYWHRENTPPFILDACSGSGILGNAVKKVLEKVNYSPVLFSAEIKNGWDVMKTNEREKFDVIICNPPWKLSVALPIYRHLEKLLAPNGVLIFIINNVFCYQGSDRAEELDYQKYYFLPRWTFKPAGRPLLDCGVMVKHENGCMGETAANLRPYIPLKRVEGENK